MCNGILVYPHIDTYHDATLGGWRQPIKNFRLLKQFIKVLYANIFRLFRKFLHPKPFEQDNFSFKGMCRYIYGRKHHSLILMLWNKHLICIFVLHFFVGIIHTNLLLQHDKRRMFFLLFCLSYLFLLLFRLVGPFWKIRLAGPSWKWC